MQSFLFECPDERTSVQLFSRVLHHQPHPIERPKGPIWLYGNGELGQLAQQYLKLVGCPVAGVFEGEEPAPLNSCVVVCIVTSPYVKIEKELSRRGVAQVLPFYDLTEFFKYKHPLSNGWRAPMLTARDSLNIQSILPILADDRSRAHYLQFLAWRRLRQEWVFEGAPVVKTDQFFLPNVKLTSDEVFLDGGSCYGDVTDEIIKKTKGNVKVVAVEPDTGLSVKLYDRLKPKIRMLNAVLAEAPGVLPFWGGFGYCSRIDPKGEGKAAITIDAIREPFTFIKLHLEGYELPALKGGVSTLTAYRPIVAVTVCHNMDGMWKIPLWLIDNLNNYKFFFRQHCWCGSNAVVYAVPEERL